MVQEDFSIHGVAPRPLQHVDGLGVGAALVMLVLAVGLLLTPLPDAGRIVRALESIGHVVIGAVLAAAFRALWLRGAGMGNVGATLLGVLFAVGTLLVLGVIQPLVGEVNSVNDFVAGASGAAGVSLFPLARRPGAAAPLLAVLLGLGLFAYGARTGVLDIVDALGQERELPLLSGFERSLELGRWTFEDATVERVRGHQTQGSWSLEARVDAGRIGRLVLAWPVGNWDDWDAFAFDVQSDGVGLLRVGVQVWDRDDDDAAPANRYEGDFLVDPSGSTVQIPLSEIAAGPGLRRLDLARVRGVAIILDGTSAERVVHLDNVRLLREPR